MESTTIKSKNEVNFYMRFISIDFVNIFSLIIFKLLINNTIEKIHKKSFWINLDHELK